MSGRIRCAYCQELAVAWRVEKDGTRLPVCAYHMTGRADGAPPGPPPAGTGKQADSKDA